MAKVFISYSKRDREVADRLAAELTARGHDVWWDRNLISGTFFRTAIDRKIAESAAVLVVWSKYSVKSKWVISEIDQADEEHKLICTRTSGLAEGDIPKPYNTYHTILWTDFAGVLQSIELAVRGDLATSHTDEAERKHTSRAGVLDRVYWKAIEASEDEEDFAAYLQQFPSGKFTALARHRLSYLQHRRAQTPQPTAHDPEATDHVSRIIMLLNGRMDHGGPFWCYVALKPSRFEEFKVAEKAGTINVYEFDEWGEVIVSEEGEFPPYDVTEKVAEMYGSDVSTFFTDIDPIREINQKMTELDRQEQEGGEQAAPDAKDDETGEKP